MTDPLRPKMPKRPDCPIEGRSVIAWAIDYHRELSDYFRAKNGHYADHIEWDVFIDEQFHYQQHRDAELRVAETEQ